MEFVLKEFTFDWFMRDIIVVYFRFLAVLKQTRHHHGYFFEPYIFSFMRVLMSFDNKKRKLWQLDFVLYLLRQMFKFHRQALIQQLPLCRSKCSIISELSRVLSRVLGRGALLPTQSRGFPHFTTGSPLLSFWWQFHKRKQCTIVLHEDFHSSPCTFAGAKTKV